MRRLTLEKFDCSNEEKNRKYGKRMSEKERERGMGEGRGGREGNKEMAGILL